MRKQKSNMFAALLSAGAMFFGGIFASCSFLDTGLSDYDKNALAVGIYLQQQEQKKNNPGTITLYKNGNSEGEQSDLAAAFAAIPESGSDTYLITLTTGTYNVTGLTVKTSNSIEMRGLGSDNYGQDVIIYGQGSDMTQESTRSTLSFQGSCDVVLKNLTVQNSYGTTTGTAQAEALGVGPTAHSGTLAAYNCSFLSGQDTICTEGKAWFYKCYVEGDVDFLWIESRSSKVALYENCVLHAIGTRTTKAYFAAPRLPVANTVGKGVVIFNSTLKADSELKEVYLGRNPWDKDNDTKKGTSYFDDYYENIAVVGSTWEGPATLNAAVWSGSGAHGTDNQQFVGFKTDSNFSASSNASTNGSAVLTSEQVSAEYGDRNLILNRVYNITNEAFENDSSSRIWDISTLESQFGATASGDLPEETADTTTATWDFQSMAANAVSIEGATGTIESNLDGVVLTVDATSGKLTTRGSDAQFITGAIIKVPVCDGSVVTVISYPDYHNYTVAGTAASADTTTYTATSSDASTGYIEIVATGSAYLYSITVTNIDASKLPKESYTASYDLTAMSSITDLTFNNCSQHSAGAQMGNASSITFDVLGACTVNVYVCFSATGTVTAEGKSATLATSTSTNSTSKYDKISLAVSGPAAVSILTTAATYINKIEVAYTVDKDSLPTLTTAATYTPSSYDGLTVSGLTANTSDGRFQGTSGTLKLTPTAKSLVDVYFYYKATGTIAAGSSSVSFSTTSNSTNAPECASLVVASGTETTISATAETYITKVVVRTLSE